MFFFIITPAFIGRFWFCKYFLSCGNRNECCTIYTYLTAWWHHKCVTLHVSNVYFIELNMSIGRLYCVRGKTSTFVSIITLAFLGRFFIPFISVKTGMNTPQKVNKLYIILTVSALPGKTKSSIKRTHFETIVVDRLLQIAMRSIEPVVCNFCRTSSGVHPF